MIFQNMFLQKNVFMNALQVETYILCIHDLDFFLSITIVYKRFRPVRLNFFIFIFEVDE